MRKEDYLTVSNFCVKICINYSQINFDLDSNISTMRNREIDISRQSRFSQNDCNQSLSINQDTNHKSNVSLNRRMPRINNHRSIDTHSAVNEYYGVPRQHLNMSNIESSRGMILKS